MRIAITGGAGFLGARLADELLKAGSLSLAGAAPAVIEEIVLVDRVAPREPLASDPRITAAIGDLAELLPDVLEGIDLVYHLAAIVSSEAERDLELGLQVNLHATLELLQAAAAQPIPPRLVFASSLAVFGGTDLQPLPPVIEDMTLPTPQSSYGIQKFIGEQLVTDFARRGLVPARTVRLMTVSVRPGAPNAAASSFLSGIVREPLAGVRSASPVPAATEVAVSSPARTIEGLLAAATTSDEKWGPLTALTLPSVTTTVGEMVAALERVAGAEVSALVDWVPDESIIAIVTTWPSRFDTARARGLGLAADPDFESIIRAYVADLG